ncbi:MAG: cold-shock protein [Actinomycetota bacterium]
MPRRKASQTRHDPNPSTEATRNSPESATMFLDVQGVIKAFDPSSGDGVVIRDNDRSEFNLSSDAPEGSLFRMLRQGQRVLFSLDSSGAATKLRFGSERDMDTPGA